MPRQGPLPINIDAASEQASIRGIAEHQVEATGWEVIGNISKIKLHNFDPRVTTIDLHIPARQACQLRLNFHADPFPSLPSTGHDQWNHPAPGSQIDDAIDAGDLREPRQQHGIQREAIAPLVLIEKEPPLKQGITSQQDPPLPDDFFVRRQRVDYQSAEGLREEVGGLVGHDQAGAGNVLYLFNARRVDEKTGIVVACLKLG
jgi:hypothetical protein